MNSNLFENENEIIRSIVSTVKKVLQTNDYFRLCLSGGTSILKTIELFSTERIPWEKIVIYQTDERIVSLDCKDSNYSWIKKILGNTGAILKPFYTGYSELESKESYDLYLKEYCNDNNCAFDLLLLGYGVDGHIASLFPGGENIEVEDHIQYIEEKQNGYQRLSLSLSLLKSSNLTFIISYGEKNIIF